MDELSSKISELRKFLETPSDSLTASQAKWESEYVAWTTLKPLAAKSTNGAKLAVQDDSSVLVSGKSPDKDTYELLFGELPEFTAIRIEVLTA